MHKKLDRAANLAILVLCLVSAVTWGRHYLMTEAATGVDKGDRVRELAAALPADADSALVIALATDCRYCTESLPFYRQLVEASRSAPVIVAVASEQERQRVSWLTKQAGFDFDAVLQVDFRQARLVATPTLLLVDRRGKVLERWVGALLEPERQAVLRSLV